MGRRTTIPCKVDDCGKDAAPNQTMCSMHRRRVRLYGDPHKTLRPPRGHVDAPPEPPDPAPAQALREALEQQRKIGNSFDWAWSTARTVAMQVAGPDRSSWWMVFAETQDVWRSAYVGKADTRMAVFAALGLDRDDRDPRVDHRRSGPELVVGR